MIILTHLVVPIWLLVTQYGVNAGGMFNFATALQACSEWLTYDYTLVRWMHIIHSISLLARLNYNEVILTKLFCQRARKQKDGCCDMEPLCVACVWSKLYCFEWPQFYIIQYSGEGIS